MTTQRDIINQIAYAKKEGHAEGEAKGRQEGLEAGRAEEKSAIAAL